MTERTVTPTPAQRSLLPATITRNTRIPYFCKWVTVYYYQNGSAAWLYRFADAVGWCGNGEVAASLSDRPAGPDISWAGTAAQERSAGIYFGPQHTEYYGGWAWETYIVGKVEVCAPSLATCWIIKYPYYAHIQVNVYADGGSKGYVWQTY